MTRQHKTKGRDARTRAIQRALRTQLKRLFPDADVEPIMDEIRPLMIEIARDGIADHDAVWHRLQAAPKFKVLAEQLRCALAKHGSTPKAGTW